MGTPEFAVESLDAIIKSHHEVVGVVTVPDKPAGRGKKIQFSAVKNYALENNLILLQPDKLKNPDFQEKLKKLNADVFVVVAFRMLPKEVWAMPKYGTFNLHASLLPQYRGAAPINWAIINGETESGATTFFIDEKIDTGEIIANKKTEIKPDDLAGDLHDKLMVMGATLVVETLNEIAKGDIITKKQRLDSDTELKDAPKIFKNDCKIDWNLPALKIHNLIRGLSPYPAAFTGIQFEDGKIINLKIFQSKIISGTNSSLQPGEIHTDGSNFLHVKCGDSLVSLVSVQAEGKKRMTIEGFLNGFRHIHEVKFV